MKLSRSARPFVAAGQWIRWSCARFVAALGQYRLAFLVLFGALALPGCATLPSSGPTASAVVRGARDGAQTPYTVVDISAGVLNAMPSSVNPGAVQMSALGAIPARPRADMIREGDTLSILVFEVGITLFSGQPVAAEAIRTPTAGAQQIVTVVREDGTTDLPYIGTLRASGLYPEQLAEEARRRLARISQSPQVVVNISDTAHNVVYVSGAIAKPGRYRLTAAHERLLDILALAGGPADNANNVEIKVLRGTQVVQAPLNEISIETPANFELAPDDRVEVVLRRPSYTVFGATDKVSQIALETKSLNLAEAVARATGPSDSRANPRGVFVFRLEESPTDAHARAVVYRLNMLKPESYFLAQRFPIKDKDVILFSNSSSNLTQKMLTMISQLLNPILPVLYLVR